MNGTRIYFVTTDPLIKEQLDCYADFQRSQVPLTNEVGSEEIEVITVTDCGVFYDRMAMEKTINGNIIPYTTIGRKVQPHWFFEIAEAKKSEVVFPDYEGRFNEYPVLK